jgi:SAM-dependent methyltransferase
LLFLAAELGIADVLAGGPLTSSEVAEMVGADPIALHRVMRGLVIDGVLAEHGDGRFVLTPAGDLLREDVPGSIRGSVLVRGGPYYRAAAGLLDAVRSGRVAFEQAHGTSFFDYLGDHPREAAAFQGSMAARSAQEAADVVAAYDFGRFRRLVDVGGGQGILLAAILRRTPHLTAVLFDLPQAVGHARVRLEKAGVLDRCELVAGDFFEGVPSGADAYLLSRVIHDWDDGAARRILARCHAAMAEGGTIVLVEAVLPALAQEQPAVIRMDLHMLTLFNNGRERTAAEFAALLTSVGFAPSRVIPTRSPAGVCVIEAERGKGSAS